MGRNLKYVRIAVMTQSAVHRQRYETNADRKAKSYNSKLGKYMRKTRTLHNSNNLADIWEFEFNKIVTKLSFLILIYLYTKDDDVISSKEERSIKKILKKKSEYLVSSDYDDIAEFIDKLPDLAYVMNYLNANKIKSRVFNASIKTVKKLISKKTQYTSILKDLNIRYNAEQI